MSEPTWIAIAALAALQLVVALLVLLRGGGRDASILHGKIAAIEANVAVISQGVSRMNQSSPSQAAAARSASMLKDLQLTMDAIDCNTLLRMERRSMRCWRSAINCCRLIPSFLLPTTSVGWTRPMRRRSGTRRRPSFETCLGRIEETKKYIKTGERTFPFAFMFIPAESIYYSMLTGEIGCDQQQRTLIQQATAENVFIVSPATLYVYLHMVMEGLTGLEIEGGVRQIVSRIKELNPQLETFGGSYKRIGEALRGLAKAYESGGGQLQTFEQTLRRATSSGELGQ